MRARYLWEILGLSFAALGISLSVFYTTFERAQQARVQETLPPAFASWVYHTIDRILSETPYVALGVAVCSFIGMIVVIVVITSQREVRRKGLSPEIKAIVDSNEELANKITSKVDSMIERIDKMGEDKK